MKVFNTSLALSTEARTEVADITERVRDALQQAAVTSGIAVVNTMHTTCAIFVNEYQHSLADDITTLAARLVPERNGYRHDDPRYSDCERGNAQAHLRTALLGRSVTVPVNDNELTLGRFQSIIFAEFDGPRPRDISIQVLGV